MITVSLDPQGTNTALTLYKYRVAGHEIATDIPLGVLVPYPGAAADADLVLVSRDEPANVDEAGLVYRGPGWLGNRWREFACWTNTKGYRLTIEGVGVFSVSPEGNSVQLDRTEPRTAPAVVIEAALGPSLILALALQGTWCLHASAATFGGRVVAFAGESGNGKSTLTAFLGRDGGAAWRGLADDVLPVTPESDGLEVLPHFPQLKILPEAQPAVGQPERMPLQAIYLLSAPEAGQAAPEIQALSTREAMLALVRHTVAARLFDRELLARHMSFCATAAARIPVRRLTYPRQLAFLPQVRDALGADLEVAVGSRHTCPPP